MKKISIFLMLILFSIGHSQVGPTLGIGLETLTMNKGTIDVEVLTKIIMEKQKELKKEALKRFMFRMFPDTNYTTRFYVQNSLNILLNEKNPQVIEKEILELTTNYAIALGVTKALEKLDSKIFENNVKINYSTDYIANIKTLSFDEKFKSLKELENDKINIENTLRKKIEERKVEDAKKTLSELDQKEKEIRKIKRYLLKKNVESIKTINLDSTKFKFGQKLDVVSLALSENEKLIKKGFFKNKIDYREEQPPFISEEKDRQIKDNINSAINPYIENYNIIKTFLSEAKISNVGSIGEELTNIYLSQLNYDEINVFLKKKSLVNADIQNELLKLNNLLSIKNDILKLKELKIATISNDPIKDLDVTDVFLTNNSERNNNIVNIYNNIKLKSDELKKDLPKLESLYSSIDKYKIKPLPSSRIESIIKSPTSYKKNLEIVRGEKKLKDSLVNINSLNLQNKEESLKIIENKIEDISIIYKINEELKNTQIENKESLQDFNKNFNKNIEELDFSIKETNKNIAKTRTFFKAYIDDLITQIENSNNIKINENNEEVKNLLVKIIPSLFEKLNYLRTDKDYTLSDISFLENDILKEIVLVKTLDNNNSNSEYYNDIITSIKILTPLLKIKLLANKEFNIKYSENLLSLFEFIGNLGRLDKADTYSSIIDLIRENNGKITEELPNGAFKESYKIFVNGIKKYTLINPNAEKEYVEIDVVSFLSDLQQYYDRNNPSKFSLYLTLGLNQNFFINKFQFPDSNEKISTVGFASEKIGVKYKLMDFKKFRGYENVIKSDVYLNKRSPFINEWYLTLYGSGLLYSLANTSTNQNFNFAHAGLATGLRFYNALDFNVLIGFPFVKNQRFGNNAFFGLGLDIPLGEYLEKLGSK